MSRVETNPLVTLPIPTFTTDAEGRVLVWNDAAAELTGRASREVVGQKSWKGFSNRRTTTPLDAALTAGENSSVAYRFLSASGDELDVTFAVRVKLREDGEPDGATVCLMPATQSKASHGQLVADHATSALMMVDSRFEVQWANAAAKELFSRHVAALREDWPSFKAEDLVGADIGPLLGDHRKALADARAPQTVHVTIGSTLFRVGGSPVRDERGGLLGSTLEWQDVTSAKAAEDRGATMSSFVNGAMACVMMCDNDRRISYLNPSVRKMLGKYQPILAKRFPGFDVEKLVGHSVDIFHVDPSKQARMFTDHSIHPYKSEIQVAGLEFTLNLTALYDSAGNQTGSAVEWFDQNARATYRKEVQALYEAATQGSLSARGDVAKMDDTYRPMLQSINEIMDAILAPVGEIQSSLGRLSDGDLRGYVTGAYQGDHGRLKDAMNGTLDSLNEILGQVRTAADQIASGSAQVASSAQSLSGGATEQAAAVEEITASIGEMTDQTRGNAESATQARQLASEAGNLAETGDERMRAMVKAMADIDESSQSISKIIKVIDEIAFQTNLLALNAAVEAARAGVHGKGFAVVAEEVRNLAARSANAAKETTAMIEGSIKKVAHGTNIAEETAQALSRIVASVSKVKDLVAEIAAASNEQAQGIAQVDQGLKQVDQVTQQNTAGAEESASAAEQLSAQAARLRELVARFKLKEAEQVAMPEITPELLAALQAYLRAQGGNLNLPGVPAPASGGPRPAQSGGRPAQPAYTNGQGHAPSGNSGPRGAAGTFVALTDDEFGRY